MSTTKPYSRPVRQRIKRHRHYAALRWWLATASSRPMELQDALESWELNGPTSMVRRFMDRARAGDPDAVAAAKAYGVDLRP